MRLINADKLKHKAQKVATESWKMKLTAKTETILNQFIDWIDEAETIDAVPVVRCEFCEKRGKALDCPYSVSTGLLPDPQDYCSMGVRKKMKRGNIDG